MKDTILTEMPINELNDLLLSEKERLAKLKMSHAVSPLENPLSIKYSAIAHPEYGARYCRGAESDAFAATTNV